MCCWSTRLLRVRYITADRRFPKGSVFSCGTHREAHTQRRTQQTHQGESKRVHIRSHRQQPIAQKATDTQAGISVSCTTAGGRTLCSRTHRHNARQTGVATRSMSCSTVVGSASRAAVAMPRASVSACSSFDNDRGLSLQHCQVKPCTIQPTTHRRSSAVTQEQQVQQMHLRPQHVGWRGCSKGLCMVVCTARTGRWGWRTR